MASARVNEITRVCVPSPLFICLVSLFRVFVVSGGGFTDVSIEAGHRDRSGNNNKAPCWVIPLLHAAGVCVTGALMATTLTF